MKHCIEAAHNPGVDARVVSIVVIVAPTLLKMMSRITRSLCHSVLVLHAKFGSEYLQEMAGEWVHIFGPSVMRLLLAVLEKSPCKVTSLWKIERRSTL